MPASPRIIRRRIKSVTNTRKITKAMELVAASKMRRAVASVTATRPYAEAAWRAIKEMARVTDPTLHPLLAARKGRGRELVILFTSDRGLCGGFNTRMMATLFLFLAGRKGEMDFLTVGKKGQAALLRSGKRIVASFTELANNPTIADIRPIADLAVSDFIGGTYDAVHLAYTDYRSALTQKPTVQQLLPIVRIEGLGEVGRAASAEERPPSTNGNQEYLFEPSPKQVLDVMLPRLVEAGIYQALLESSASEHSARMLAMRSATDAARDMLGDLTLTYNQARQAGITREIAEISSGKAALETP